MLPLPRPVLLESGFGVWARPWAGTECCPPYRGGSQLSKSVPPESLLANGSYIGRSPPPLVALLQRGRGGRCGGVEFLVAPAGVTEAFDSRGNAAVAQAGIAGVRVRGMGPALGWDGMLSAAPWGNFNFQKSLSMATAINYITSYFNGQKTTIAVHPIFMPSFGDSVCPDLYYLRQP